MYHLMTFYRWLLLRYKTLLILENSLMPLLGQFPPQSTLRGSHSPDLFHSAYVFEFNVTFFVAFCCWAILIVWMYHSVFIHSSVDGYLGCLQVLVIMSKSAVNILIQVFVDTCFLNTCVNIWEWSCWAIE